MNESLKQHLLEMEAHLAAKIEGAEVRLGVRIGALEARLEAVEARLNETPLPTGFQKSASLAEARVQSSAAILRALDLDVWYIKDRLERLERNAGISPLSS